MQAFKIIPIVAALLFSAAVNAASFTGGEYLSRSAAVNKEKVWYYPFEIGELNIKLASDGTGIIKDVSCSDCDFKFVKVTPDTAVYVNGIKRDLMLARERAGKQAYIKFNKDTAEVVSIHWAE